MQLVDEEIEQLATMSPMTFKEFGLAEPSVTPPLAELELSTRSNKAESPEGRDGSGEAMAAVCVEGMFLPVICTFYIIFLNFIIFVFNI